MEADVRLTFDSLLPLVLEASDVYWRQLHVEETNVDVGQDQGKHDALCILRINPDGRGLRWGVHTGSQLAAVGSIPELWTRWYNDFRVNHVKHGKTWKHIHGYFSNLEFRKCCLSLRGKPTQFNNIRLVNSGYRSDQKEEAMGRISKNAPIVDKLNDRELAVYGQALLCAQFPRLCISTPSGSASPELYSYTSQLRSNASATESISLTSDPDESASVIPTETLCEILRLAFGITRERAAQYERMVYEQYKKKTREKILVEELMSQLSFLENNKHPFYNSSTFLSKSAYEQWQQLQRQHIMALINKIWHFSLPPLKGSIHYNPAQFHENYKILMEKMVRFENSNRPDELGSGPVISSPLSTAALRLLKEYGLRYGVGEQYRRLVYLEYLAEHFENEVWYIQHLHSVLEGLLTGLPSVYSRAVMVQQEYEMFLHTSDILYGQCENSLTRIRRLFTAPNVNAAQGVATLLELLALTLRLKTFLQDKTLEPMDYLLTRYTKKSLVTSYERHKLISLTDLQISTLEDQITPKLISRVIILIRNDVKEYKDVFNTVYASYLDIARLAAETFYTQLMEDMRTLCSSISPSQQSKEEEILPLLALVYKLNQLDSEWADYIKLGDQSWRQWMVPESLLWMDLLRKHSRQFIMQAVCADKFEPVTLKNRSKVEENPGRTQSVTSTTTTKSLSYSEHSAFTPVKPNQRTQHVVASTSRATEVTTSPARRLPCASNSSNQQMDNANDSFQVPQVQSLQAERFQQQGSSAKSGIYIAKSLSSPELVNLKKYARSIDKLQSNIGKTENVHSKSHNDLLQLRGATNKAYCNKEMPNIPKKSSSVIRSLPGSLGSDNNNNLMESGNFSFMRKGKQRKERTTKYENTPMKKSVVSSHSTEPADLTRFNQPHIEIIGVTQLPKSSQTLRGDIKTLSSDSETDYEIMDSDYSESSGEDDGDFAVDGNGQNTFPPLTAIETSWNGSLGSLCFQEYMEAEQMEPKRSPRGNVMEYPKEEKEKAVVQFIGTRGTEKEKNSPGNAFHRITKLTGEMLDAQIKRNEKQRSKIGGERISTPISSARSTPTVHWDPTTVTDEGQGERKLLVSGSLVDISCLTHRLINFAGTLCKTLCPLTTLEKMGSFTENDLDMLKSLIRARNNILDNLLQTVWLIVSDYTNNLLAFDLCGTSENKAKALVNMNLVDDVKNEFKAGFIWGCRHQQNSTFCNEYINKKAVYLADRFEPITEKMCLRLNNVWSLLGSLTKFKKEAQCAAELDHMKTLMNRLRPVELDEVLNEYDVVDLFEDDERQELQHDPAALNETSPKSKDSKNVIFAQCNDHLNMAVEGLASLLAYRMNLFFTEALHLLLSIDIPGVSLTRRLVPATEFLHNHLVTLHEVLYQPCYNHTVRKLWTLVVRDFETELDDLSSVRGYTAIHAKQLLEVIASYLRLFKNHASEIDIDEFTQETEDVCERLQLHTLSTKHLVKVHRRLDQLSQMSFSETVSDEGLPDKEFMEVMRKHLHAQRKSFDGSTLVQFLLSNIHKFHVVEENRDVSEKESSELVAEKIAQRLLDAGIIVCNEDPIQTTHPSESTETSLNSASPYPTMGIYSSPSYSASLHKSDAFSQAFRKTSESMVERCIPSEDEEPLTFGDHPRVLYAGVNAKKLIERRRASRRKTEEEKMGLSRSLPDNVNASVILMFGRSSPNDILSQSFDATLLQDKTEDHSSPAAMRNGGFGFLRSDDKIHMSASITRATTASPSVVSHVSYSSTEHFQNSADQFYRFAGQFDELLFDLDEEDNNVTLQSSQLQPDVNDQLQKVNGAMYKEKKITTEFVLNILNTRKSVDALAKNYLQSLPEHILSTAHLIAHHPPVVGCFGFIS